MLAYSNLFVCWPMGLNVLKTSYDKNCNQIWLSETLLINCTETVYIVWWKSLIKIENQNVSRPKLIIILFVLEKSRGIFLLTLYIP